MRTAALLAFLLSVPSCCPAADGSPPVTPTSAQEPRAGASKAEPAEGAAAGSSDKKAEAQAHFRAGMKKIAAKDFDGGIAELQEALRILPHPNVTFNIAKAHEDAGRTAEAVRWYREYLAMGPNDRAEVEATVRRLEGH